MYGSFSEKAAALWDFVRCERSNGTFYGTAGQCRLGVEVAATNEDKYTHSVGLDLPAGFVGDSDLDRLVGKHYGRLESAGKEKMTARFPSGHRAKAFEDELRLNHRLNKVSSRRSGSVDQPARSAQDLPTMKELKKLSADAYKKETAARASGDTEKARQYMQRHMRYGRMMDRISSKKKEMEQALRNLEERIDSASDVRRQQNLMDTARSLRERIDAL